MSYPETLDDIPFDQELEGSDDYESAFADEDAEEIEEAILSRPVMNMPELRDIQLSLEDLLADATRQVAKKKAIHTYRKELKRPDLPKESREDLVKKIRSWEDTYEWNTLNYVAMFTEDACNSCGHDTRHFAGFYYEQSHKYQQAHRIVRVEESQVYAQDAKNATLPKKILLRRETVPCCPMCVVLKGFPVNSVEVMN